MAVKPNETTESSNARLYTGVALLKVVAINPNQEEMKAMGMKAEKAPSYQKNDDKGLQTRITFYVEAKGLNEGEVIKSNIAIFLRNKKREDIFIDQFGKFGKDRTTLGDQVRNPYEGELELLSLVEAWCGIKKGQEFSLETIDGIVQNGSTTELRQILKDFPNNVFKGFLTVRDGKYQGVYNKKYEKSFGTDYSYLHKSFVKEEKYITDDLGKVDFKMYVPEHFQLKLWEGQTAAIANSALTSQTNGHSQAPQGPQGEVATGADDDVPF